MKDIPRRKSRSPSASSDAWAFAPSSSPTPPEASTSATRKARWSLIRDHINLQGANPLVGPNDDRFGVRFPDMTHAYAKEYRQIAREEAAKLGITLHEGVYAGLLGPSYETPAEIEYLRRIGADLVGMSTVAEVIAARHMGIKVLAISCVTNMAAGILDQPLSHAEVMETGERVKTTFEALLRAVLPRMPTSSRNSVRTQLSC